MSYLLWIHFNLGSFYLLLQITYYLPLLKSRMIFAQRNTIAKYMLVTFQREMRYQFELLIIVLILFNFFIYDINFIIDLFDFWLELVRVIIRLLRVFRLGKLIILESVVTLIEIVLGDWAFFEIVIVVVIQDTIVFNFHVLSLAGRCPHSVVFLALRFLLLPVQWVSFSSFLPASTMLSSL